MRRKRIVKEALGIAQGAVQALGEAHDSYQESSDQLVELTDRAISMASVAINAANDLSERLSLRDTLRAAAPGEALDAEQLQIFAETVPQWSVTTGTAGGRVVKVYSRTITSNELIPERRPGGERERETYRSLADVEHSDLGLAQIFGNYYFTGEYVNGARYDLTIHSEEPGPITYEDFARVIDAEAYLVTAGYILQPEAVPTNV